jgi:hypothetical protein
VIFGEGKDSIENSISFFQNYLVTLQNIAKGKATLDRKGKAKLFEQPKINDVVGKKVRCKEISWEKPRDGWFKCNVDASFISDNKNGAWGGVLRDHTGRVLCSA